LRDSGACVGFVGPWFPVGWPGKEVAWQLRREHWGKGFASEAARAVLNWTRDELHWEEAIHCIHPNNELSISLARRLGSSFLRTTKFSVGPPLDSVEFHVYGQAFTEHNGGAADRFLVTRREND
jgi:RimJ/RimL family protein N-acetyltransferase